MMIGSERSLLVVEYFEKLNEQIVRLDSVQNDLFEYKAKNSNADEQVLATLEKVNIIRAQMIGQLHQLTNCYSEYQERASDKTKENLDEILNRLEYTLSKVKGMIVTIEVEIAKYQIGSITQNNITDPDLATFQKSMNLASKFLAFVSRTKNTKDFIDPWLGQH